MPSPSGTASASSRTLTKAFSFLLSVSSFVVILSVNSSSQASETPNSYIIKKGDTLSGIAEKTGIGYSRTADIADANNIDNMDLIFPGQIIHLGDFLPAQKLPEAGETKQADTSATEIRGEEPEKQEAASTVDEKLTEASNDQAKVESSMASDEKVSSNFWDFNPAFSAGLAIGQSFLDVESENFEVSNQDINLDVDSSLNAELFIIMSLNQHLGMELGLHHLGVFEFSGSLGKPGQQVGTIQGEQTIQAISLSAHYKKRFQHFNAQASAGFMQARQQTSFNIDLVGSPEESNDDSENSSNPFIALELNRNIYKSWSLAPRLAWINSGDPIQSFSIRLYRPIE